jgi:acetyl-CoA carboxylase carboxyltransferase component
MSKIGDGENAGFNRLEAAEPTENPEEIYGIIPEKRDKPYKVRELISRLVDKSEFDEYKAGFGQSIICGLARVEGWAVGIVANERQVIKSKSGEMQFGGVIYSDSADKAARFIMNCNQKKIPLVFLQDVTGFMVGSRSEHGGIIKDGAKMVNAMANSVVPKFTIITGNSFGAGNYAMCGKAYDPRLIVAWPTAQIAVMGGAQAAKVILQMEKSSLKAKGEEITPEREAELLKTITDKYNKQMTPYYAASRLWVDSIIDPLETRKVISMGIEMANKAPIKEAYNVGVLQT